MCIDHQYFEIVSITHIHTSELCTSNIFFLGFKFSLLKSGTRKKRLTEHSAMKLMREGMDGKGQITFLADVPFHAQFNLCDLRKRRLHDCFACNIVEKKTISGRERDQASASSALLLPNHFCDGSINLSR